MYHFSDRQFYNIRDNFINLQTGRQRTLGMSHFFKAPPQYRIICHNEQSEQSDTCLALMKLKKIADLMVQYNFLSCLNFNL